MPIAIPLTISLGARETEETYIPAQELVRRITLAFPGAVVDWDRGKQHSLLRIQELISMGCPEVILIGERRLVDDTVYVAICFPGWPENPVFTYLSRIQTSLEGLDFEAETYDIELLKRAGHALSEALDFRISLGGGGSTLRTDVLPGKRDPWQYVREYFQPPFQVPVLRELADWKTSLHRGLLLFLRQFKQRNLIDELTQGFASYEEFASSVLEELEAIAPVQKCWSLDDEMPFSNGVLLDHGDWLTHISLNGVPRGILT